MVRGRNGHWWGGLIFEQLCDEPKEVIAELCRFPGVDEKDAEPLAAFIRKPKTLERYKTEDLNQFDAEDMERVVGLGYSVSL